ncbi:RNA polymerase sigma factor [Gimesia chilikensis]|uniref:RNA polymerase sigma factor n=1 Tax=Gimesia chilikensis TaxID=2605989 RepID=A0A517PR02_9PLAN|nr:sigma-70 family RNA polymerase sigma factor [Gimesia chilikensis]QDT21807.1 RNA polymerase sigma factor [Gimesia chilikensis]
MQQPPDDVFSDDSSQDLSLFAESVLEEMQSTISPRFEHLWDRFHQVLKDYVERRISPQLQPHVGASDILQSAFLSLWRRLEDSSKPPLTDQDDLWGFLMTIARRKLARRWRQIQTQKRGAGNVITATDYTSSTSGAAFEEIFYEEVNQQLKLELEEASDRLDVECQTIISMKLTGMTNAEIANELKCSIRRIERKNNLIRKAFTDAEADSTIIAES